MVGSMVAEAIILITVFIGLYIVLQPLRRRLEGRMREWLDRRGLNRKRATVIEVKPKKKDDPS